MSRTIHLHVGSFLAVVLFLLFLPVPRAIGQTCAPPPEGIISWWSFDETSGSTAEDFVGRFDGAHTNGPTPALGLVGGALRFNGANDYVVVQDDPIWAFGANNFTIEFWANFDTSGGGSIGHPGDIFIGSDEGGGTRNKWFFALGGGVLNFHLNGPSTGSRFFPRAPFSPTPQQWYHLAVTREGSRYTIYVDGQASATATDSRAVPNANAQLTIGQAEQLGYFDGRLDEMTVYSRALSAVEIAAISDAGSAGKCAELQIRPRSGGDTGTVSVELRGSQFSDGTTVKLARLGETDIVGAAVSVIQEGRQLSATFDLTGQANGLWDVVVEDPLEEDLVLVDGFTVEPGRSPELYAAIVGLPVIRANREQKYWVFVGNRGNVDAVFAGQTLLIAAGAFSPDDTLVAGSFRQLGGSGTSGGLELPAAAASGLCGEARDALANLRTTLAGLEAELAARWEDYRDEEDPDKKDEILSEIERLKKEITKVKRQITMLEAWIAANCEEPNPNPDPIVDPVIPVVPPIIMPLPITVPVTGCYPISVTIFSLPTGVFLPLGLAATANGDGFSLPLSGGSKEICTVASFDPNDKVASEGSGDGHFVSGKERLSYTIFFENLETATAPAQEVIVVDQLDADAVDLSTLSLGPLSFGEELVIPQSGVTSFSSEVDLRPASDLIVRIGANLNPNTGMLTWSLQSLDPDTGDPPADPLAGFLPPNLNPPEGDGSVSFSVMPVPGLETGAEIRNQASIVFDLNEPIVTPEWLNTLDNTAPTSTVLPLPGIQSSESFEVEWSGADEGAGLRDYNVFVSVDGGNFLPFIEDTSDTSATFDGENGRTYSFYSVARDLAGNREDPPEVGDTSTTVAANGPPVAVCEEATVPTDLGVCSAGFASVDSGSFDPDGDPITVEQTPPAPYVLGSTQVTLTVTDDNGASDSCTATVTVVDVEAPEFTLSLAPDILWPPNHRMVEITALPTTSDVCDPAPNVELVGITMDEGDESLTYDPLYDQTTGDGHTTNDIQVSEDGRVFLRAERAGTGDGRVYTLTYLATDASGNATSAMATVTVPHNQ